jgi:hypothetical protein
VSPIRGPVRFPGVRHSVDEPDGFFLNPPSLEEALDWVHRVLGTIGQGEKEKPLKPKVIEHLAVMLARGREDPMGYRRTGPCMQMSGRPRYSRPITRSLARLSARCSRLRPWISRAARARRSVRQCSGFTTMRSSWRGRRSSARTANPGVLAATSRRVVCCSMRSALGPGRTRQMDGCRRIGGAARATSSPCDGGTMPQSPSSNPKPKEPAPHLGRRLPTEPGVPHPSTERTCGPIPMRRPPAVP